MLVLGRGPKRETVALILRNAPSAPVAVPPPKPTKTPSRIILKPADTVWVDSSGSMHTFYEALLATERKKPGAITRVLHYGDSPTTADLITADVREGLQKRFGDGGHGFVLVGRPWAWYGHRGISIKAGGWTHQPASQNPRAADSLHGLGGVNTTGRAGATSKITLPDGGHKKMEVLYLKQPGGGEFQVKAGEQDLLTVLTDAEAKANGYSAVTLPEGTEEVKLAVTKGKVRVFGVTFEKEGPGIVYSSLGLNGVSIQMLARFFPAEHWGEQLQHQRPDLVVVNYGSNEAGFASYVERYYAKELRVVLQRVRRALPNTAILVMSPMDRGERNASGEIVSLAALPRLIEIQRQVAQEEGCAFFDTFDAMGGAGTMAKWYNGKPRLVSADFLHPNPTGAAKVGALLEEALLKDYGRWKAARGIAAGAP